jgi:hypothetical protein
VTGIIETASVEQDGDLHIRLRVDPQFTKLLNSKNSTGQKGFLVVEPMCFRPPTQSDTISEGVCNGFSQRFYVAAMHGKHVAVTGSYVQDMEHGWREIHPVTSIVIAP